MTQEQEEQLPPREAPKGVRDASVTALSCTQLRLEIQAGETQKQAVRRVVQQMLTFFRAQQSPHK